MIDEKSSVAELWAMSHLGTPMAIRVAATLRIADHIDSGINTTHELAKAVGADADALERLLRYLEKRGILSRDNAGRYGLTAMGKPLRDDHPARLRAGLDIEGMGRPELAFVQLLHSVRTGEAAFPAQFGRSFWADLAADPARAAAFNSYMGGDMPTRAPDIVAAYDWGSLGHVVDVGGGNGSLLIALLSAFPGLRGTVVDVPGTAAAAMAAMAAAGLDGRTDVVLGSLFDPLPAGAGGYVLSLVLHNWSDDDARLILRGLARAAGRDGAVFLAEDIGADGESPPTGMDLRMLAYCGGKERGIRELGALAAECGLALSAVYPAGVLSIVKLTAA